jgi:hypothetical protein
MRVNELRDETTIERVFTKSFLQPKKTVRINFVERQIFGCRS